MTEHPYLPKFFIILTVPDLCYDLGPLFLALYTLGVESSIFHYSQQQESFLFLDSFPLSWETGLVYIFMTSLQSTLRDDTIGLHRIWPQCIALWLLTCLLSCCPPILITRVQPCLRTADSDLRIFQHSRAVTLCICYYCICPSSTVANFSNKVGQIWVLLCTWLWTLSDTQYLIT